MPRKRMCFVCQRPAGKYNYYGGQVCTSCRAFFRRSAQGLKHEEYVCTKASACKTDSKSWKSCQRCRFDKCVKAGMRTKWVLPDAVKKKKKENKQEEEEVEDHKSEINKALDVALSKDGHQPLTLEETAFLIGLNKRRFQTMQLSMMKIFVDDPSFAESAFSFADRGASSTMGFISSEKLEVVAKRSLMLLFEQLGDMQPFSSEDRETLLNANCPAAMEFTSATTYDSNLSSNSHVKVALDFIRDFASRNSGLSFIQRLFERHNLTPSRDYPHLDYHSMHCSPWAANVEDEERHRSLVLKLTCWARSSSSGENDPVLTILMVLIILFSTEGLELTQRALADKIRTKYSHMLYRHLNTRYPEGEVMSKYCDSLYLPLLAQEAMQIKKGRLPVLDVDERHLETGIDLIEEMISPWS